MPKLTTKQKPDVYAGATEFVKPTPKRSHVPTARSRALVTRLAGTGLPDDQIAALLNFTLSTLHGHYSHELLAGAAKENAKVGRALYDSAKQGDTAAAVWISKARMGWRAPEAGGMAGGGSPLNLQVVFVAPDNGVATVRGISPHQREVSHEQAK